MSDIVGPTEGTPEPTNNEIEVLRGLLADFLAHNPHSEIVAIQPPPGGLICVLKPWGDDSLAIVVDPADTELLGALNAIFLPERFIAIWHRDTSDLEIIWTAFPLNPSWREIPGRQFIFRHLGKEYDCHFTASSDRLLAIARNYIPITASNTYFRNLESYRNHLQGVARHKNGAGPAISTNPRSFWIKNIEWNDDTVLALINNLNFYLNYFDTLSPTVVVHTVSEGSSIKPQTRYTAVSFPGIIDGRQIDDVLLQLWHASRKVDDPTKFLYCFRIIEYASFSYLDGKARMEIRRILGAANALDNVAVVTEQVVEALQKAKLEDWSKFEALLHDTVKPQLLWREISQNLSSFTKVIKFEGGFDLKPLIHDDATEAGFCVKGIENFHKSIRDIRNALSHGKDVKSSGVILPTVRNFELLRPWVSLISVAAAEVMHFKNVV